MSEAAVPLLIGSGASALGNYLGAQTAANASRNAANLQQQRFNEARSYSEPYIQGGQNALGIYNAAVGASGADAQRSYYEDFQTDPGFTSAQQYGLDQVNARAAAQGQTLSGNALAALNDYSMRGLQSAYDSRLDDLYRSANLGAASANALVQASTTSANNQGTFEAQAGKLEGQGLAQTGSSLASGTRNYATYYYGTQQKT